MNVIDDAKKSYYRQRVSESSPKETFQVVDELLNPGDSKKLPSSDSPESLANEFVTFFSAKVQKIRKELDSTPVDTNLLQADEVTSTPPILDTFRQTTPEEVAKIIKSSPTKTCGMDPLPTRLLKDEAITSTLLPHITRLINASLSSATVPSCLKQALITPLLKKSGWTHRTRKTIGLCPTWPSLARF